MIRKYKPEDTTKLIALLRLNTPQYFAPEEEQDYLEYLAHHSQHYFVVEDSGQLIGAGGFNLGFDEGKTARISWDIIHPDFQGRGVGKVLTQFRIDEIKKEPAITKIVVRTTQLVHRFYEKNGFVLERTEKDFWAKGFDLYQMTLELS
ncbi:GNAT family N-acetyltransferase [Pontibacter sp. MBLB2868]|uniref:GNAT family N-acetyltransferase n=1 Tax=Pontibacter sp. MBLB2868 TaxID=3451555 RepID=UPI003F74D57E